MKELYHEENMIIIISSKLMAPTLKQTAWNVFYLQFIKYHRCYFLFVIYIKKITFLLITYFADVVFWTLLAQNTY